MKLRVKSVIACILIFAAASLHWASASHAYDWRRFFVYLLIVLLASGMKVPMPRGQGTLSVNFPFILLGIVQLSPLQVMLLAACSVFAQCRFKVLKAFTLIQIAFNVANAVAATAMACYAYQVASNDGVAVTPALCFAVTAYFLANSIPMALVIGWSAGEQPFSFWKREFTWYLPLYVVGAVFAAAAHYTSQHFSLTTSLLLVPVTYAIYCAYQTQVTLLKDREEHLNDMEALHLRTIEGLAMAIEAKDQNTHDHLLRVRVYCSEIGVEMGLKPIEMQALLTAAFLHDVGKLAVPEHIVNKPGKLTYEEFEKMKIHPAVGADILERMRFPYPVAPIVRSHHEAWDGTGYPDGLAGECIPMGARILTAVDCFDALASERPYRRAMPLDDAMEAVRARSGKQFDPAVVEVLGRMYLGMEERARAQRGAILPMPLFDTSRGGGPANGFAQEDGSGYIEMRLAETLTPNLVTIDAAARTTLHESLKLIAAASQEAQTLFEMSQTLGSSLSANETISVMSSRLKRLIPFTCFAVYLRVEAILVPQYIDGDCAAKFSQTVIPLGEGISGWVAQSGKPMLNGNAQAEPNYVAERDPTAVACSGLSLPLYDLNGSVLGVITVYSPKPEAFSRDHLRILQAVEAKFSFSLQNALRFRNAEKDAMIDFVTQLPNVRQFFLGMEVQLQRAQRTGKDLCVIVCDLNAFKAVNDQHGHLTGNQLLRGIADGFRKICRSYDTVARLGGDEFVFVLPGLNKNCKTQLTQIEDVVREACLAQGVAGEVTVSAGVSYYPQDGSTAEDLLGVADRRMYLHKQQHYERVARMALPMGELGTTTAEPEEMFA